MKNLKGKGMTSHGFYNSGGKYKTRNGREKTPHCRLWENIRIRCQILPVREPLRFGNYKDVSVCEEWKDFQVFADWFEQVSNGPYYHEGWHLEKDLLSGDKKIYSPETCVFLPRLINQRLVVRTKNNGLPIGVVKQGNKLQVKFVCSHEEFNMVKFFDLSDVELAGNAYIEQKSKYLKYLANIYKNQLDPRAYDALINLKFK